VTDQYNFETYEDAAGEYRWRLQAPNGRIVADSAEGYTEERGAIEDITRVRSYAPIAKMPEGWERILGHSGDGAGGVA
jgi:uncharacterized protein YegP (UPF0339 family)